MTTVAGQTQTIPGGPVASQEAIKEGGQNGGGFFGANSTHPFENPNGITNMLEMWLILAIPFAFTYTFGKMARDQKQGWVVFATMFVLWLGMLLIVTPLEATGQPEADRRRGQPADDRPAGGRQHGGQGDPLRPGHLRLLRGVDDQHLRRRGQLPARQPDPARRRAPRWST